MSFYPTPTTGLGVPARVVLTESEVQLAIGGTHQLQQPSLVDVTGNAVTPQGVFTFLRYSHDTITVDDSGLITAIASGVTEVRVTYTDVRGSLDAALTVCVAAPTQQTKFVTVTDDFPATPGVIRSCTRYIQKNILDS